MLSRKSQLLTQTGDVIGQWKEHFKELLNPYNTSSSQEAGSEDLEETSEVIKLPIGKVPEVDEIPHDAEGFGHGGGDCLS